MTTLTHEITVTREDGKHRASCACGWEAVKTFSTPEQARTAASRVHLEVQG